MGIDYIGIFRILKWTSLMWFFQNFLFVQALPHDVNWSRSLLSWKRYSVQIWKWNINKSKIQLGCGVTISRAKRFLDNVIGQDHQQLESWTIWWNSYSFLSILRHQAILLIASDTSWATFMCHNAKLTWLLIWGEPLLSSNLESCQTFSFFGHSDK